MENIMKALICGSFDPVTNGHLDIIKRAAALFDSVVVGIFVNSEKKYFLNSKDRLELLAEATKDLDNVTIDFSEGLVAKYVEENGIDVIVKGVRNAADFEYEFKMAEINKQINKNAETLFLPASKETELLSSSFVKNKLLAGEDISAFVPECVKKALINK